MTMVISFFSIPLLAALLTLCFLQPSSGYRKAIAIISCLIQIVLSLFAIAECLDGKIYVSLMGGWAVPYGITLAIDLFSALMLFASLLVYLTAILYGLFEKDEHAEPYLRLPLLFFLQIGTNLTLITGDFFNLFVAFEIMLTSSYGLLSVEAQGSKVKNIFSYVVINLAGSLIFLCGAAMVYGYTGNLNMAALAQFFENKGSQPLVIAFAFLMLCVFGLKIGVFPLYFWLPDSYPILPYSLAALFGGLLSKIGIYVFMRLFITILPHDLLYVRGWMIALAMATMLLGVLGAVSKNTIKGILSYHIVSQMGYIVLAIGIFTPLALTAALFFTLHNMWVKSSLFLYGGVAGQYFKTDRLDEMGDGLTFLPWAGFFFLLQALSLAGLPPLSGFWGKYLIISESLLNGQTTAALLALLVSWMTLFSMLKIWISVFWGKPKQYTRHLYSPALKFSILSGLGLVIFSLGIGLGAEYALEISDKTINFLLNKQHYIQQINAFAKIRNSL